HEALITRWTTLRSWLDEAMARKHALERLAAAARDWERIGRRPDALWRGRQLADVPALDSSDLGASERAFLDASQRVRRRTRFVRVAVPVLLVATVLAATVGAHLRARAEIAATVGRSRQTAAGLEAEARPLDEEGAQLRQRALHLFDEGAGLLAGGARAESWKEAEALWARLLDVDRAAESAYGRAAAVLDTALFVDPLATQVRDDLVRVLGRRRAVAERTYRRELYDELTSRLTALRAVQRGWNTESSGATLVLGTTEAAAEIGLARYKADETGHLSLTAAELWKGPERTLVPGSYLISVGYADCGPLTIPVLMTDGLRRNVALPTQDDCRRVPHGYALVPAGVSLTGSDDPTLREALDGAPLHEVSLPAYLIGRHEVTVGEYAEWLDVLPPDARARRAPKSHTDPTSVELAYAGAGQWTL